MEKGAFAGDSVKGRSLNYVIISVDRGMGSTPIVSDTEENIWPLLPLKLRKGENKKKQPSDHIDESDCFLKFCQDEELRDDDGHFVGAGQNTNFGNNISSICIEDILGLLQIISIDGDKKPSGSLSIGEKNLDFLRNVAGEG